MDKNVHIISLRERTDLVDAAIDYANKSWPFISKYFAEAVRQTITSKGQLPLSFLLMKQDKIIGFYTLQEHDVVTCKDLTPWITLVFVDKAERGNNLVRDILLHGRKLANQLGYQKVYLCTNHIHLYEKYGFKEIGLDMFDWGRPAKLYEASTIPEKQGKIVFLNGVSSSGKTTLALELQKHMEDPCFLISQDIFRQMWGNRYYEDSPENLYNMSMSLMYKTIKLYSNEGKNVIVDHLIFTDEFLASTNGEGILKDVVRILSQCPVLFVHVVCDIETLRSREKARGDREIGHAEQQLELLWPKDHYDLTIDTGAMTTKEAVNQILEALDHMDEYTAFHDWDKKLKFE